MPADPQVQNALSATAAGQRQLLDTIVLLKGLRIRLDSLGVPRMTDEQLTDSLVGELSHLSRGKVRRLLAAMDVLDAALLTPADLDGVTLPPVKAVVDVIR